MAVPAPGREDEKDPKSCIKASMHGLLLAGELQKKGIVLDGLSSWSNTF